jgi:hypothetical protein
MTSYFDKNKRYQIVFPYTSDKIYVENNLNEGADKCYREIEERKMKIPLFVIHDIDSNKLFDVEIPKYKNANHNPNPNLNLNKGHESEHIDITNLDIPTNVNAINVNSNMNPSINNDIIVRINKLEYDVMKIKNEIISNRSNNKDKEESCTII